MADTIEKIYCSDRGDDNALTAAILSNNRRDDGYNNWMNNRLRLLLTGMKRLFLMELQYSCLL